jgi:hypothetical protein
VITQGWRSVAGPSQSDRSPRTSCRPSGTVKASQHGSRFSARRACQATAISRDPGRANHGRCECAGQVACAAQHRAWASAHRTIRRNPIHPEDRPTTSEPDSQGRTPNHGRTICPAAKKSYLRYVTPSAARHRFRQQGGRRSRENVERHRASWPRTGSRRTHCQGPPSLLEYDPSSP